MTLHLTPAEAEQLKTAGSGVLFRPGECECRSCLYGNREHPPAEFVEAAAACETCGGDNRPVPWDQWPGFRLCPDCDGDGKRRVAAVVPCPTCSIEQDGRIRPGLELCTRCVPRHWEFCSTCTVWSDDEFTITSKAGLVTVGHVVVTWGPLVVVSDKGAYVGRQSVFEHGGDLWFTFPIDGVVHAATLPPDVDPQTLVGQYAIGVKVVS